MNTHTTDDIVNSVQGHLNVESKHSYMPAMRKVRHDGLDQINMPPHPVFLLPGTFLFLSGSPFETILHDDAYGAFMTPPLYTSTREDDEYMIMEDTVRYFSMQVVKRDRKGVKLTRSQVT